jgi:hypothetical protein
MGQQAKAGKIGPTKGNYLTINEYNVLASHKRNLPFRDSKAIVRAQTFGVQIQVGLDKTDHGEP